MRYFGCQMADVFDKIKRSWIMSRVGGRDTAPEKAVRTLLHTLGFRFRLQARELPGRPDIVLPRYRTVIFVHGCFWHAHRACKRASVPATRRQFWHAKLSANVQRDRRNARDLRKMGWRVITVWSCRTRDGRKLMRSLTPLLNAKKARHAQGRTPHR